MKYPYYLVKFHKPEENVLHTGTSKIPCWQVCRNKFFIYTGKSIFRPHLPLYISRIFT